MPRDSWVAQVVVEDGQPPVYVEMLAPVGGDAGARNVLHMEEFCERLTGFAAQLMSSIRKGFPREPKELTIEFGVKLAVSAGKLVSVLASASTEGSIVVKATWETAPRK